MREQSQLKDNFYKPPMCARLSSTKRILEIDSLKLSKIADRYESVTRTKRVADEQL